MAEADGEGALQRVIAALSALPGSPKVDAVEHPQGETAETRTAIVADLCGWGKRFDRPSRASYSLRRSAGSVI